MARKTRKTTGRNRSPRAAAPALPATGVKGIAGAPTAGDRAHDERLAPFGSQLDAVTGLLSQIAERIERLENRIEEVVAKRLLETEARLAGWVDRVVERRVGPEGAGETPLLTPALAEVRRIEEVTTKLEGLMALLDQRQPLPFAAAEDSSPRERDADRA